MITFHHRFVHFGTRFTPAPGFRQLATSEDSHLLFENEIVVDVGGCCFNQNNETKLILDHHFASAGENFPSASAAVLHNAAAIHQLFQERLCGKDQPVWIATHEKPDFDALCSSFLVRGVIDQGWDFSIPVTGWTELGLHPRGWHAVESVTSTGSVVRNRMDWFAPELHSEDEHIWPILLAAYASCVDNCRRIRCQRTRAVHSVLYAAINRRGRGYLKDRWTQFFMAAANAIRSKKLNPFYDSLFDEDSEFAPELRLLELEEGAYQRDIAKSRRTLVHIQQTNIPFDALIHTLEGTTKGEGIPLLEKCEENGLVQINARHLNPFLDSEQNKAVQVDGLFIRDPECLLFKEWARDDYENSLLGHGFLFTAIAYSNGRPESSVNRTDYYFSLDPEKIPSVHLYNVWARLQSQEVASRMSQGSAQPSGEPRRGFQNRARGFEQYFNDPWFDGQNYRATIVATPWHGTYIAGSGVRPDLTDDPITAMVSEELEHTIFECSSRENGPDAALIDFGLSFSAKPRFNKVTKVPLRESDATPLGGDCFRFVNIPLSHTVELTVPGIAAQIGRCIWPFLESGGTSKTPNDFEQKHLSIYQDRIVVWNRNGLGIAYKSRAKSAADNLKEKLMQLAVIAHEINAIIESEHEGSHGPKRLDGEHILSQGEQLLKRVVQLRMAASKPENRPLRQLMDAIRFDCTVESLNALNQQVIGRAEEKRALILNLLVGLFALTFALPTLILTFFTVVHGPSEMMIALIACTPFMGGIATATALFAVYKRKRDRKQ